MADVSVGEKQNPDIGRPYLNPILDSAHQVEGSPSQVILRESTEASLIPRSDYSPLLMRYMWFSTQLRTRPLR